jgi:hypothetical protein
VIKAPLTQFQLLERSFDHDGAQDQKRMSAKPSSRSHSGRPKAEPTAFTPSKNQPAMRGFQSSANSRMKPNGARMS